MADRDPGRTPLLFGAILPLRRADVIANLTAGLSLAAMNIPQAMGYARIAGMPVITGIYTLLLPICAFAALGSSRYLVVASDSATAAILAGGIDGMAPAGSAEYVALAGLVALITGVFLLIARLFKLGFLADFLSRTVLIGFLTGVGFQVGIAMLGEMLKIDAPSNNPLLQLGQVLGNIRHAHLPSLGLSVAVIAFILGASALAPRFPAALVAVVASIAASAAFDFAGSGIVPVGPVAGGLPRLAVPALEWHVLWDLVPIAASCFVMIVAQSSVTARAYAARHRQPFDENRDLLGLSAANAAAALSGTFVVNGSPTQTAMVETSGGNSQLAQLSTALVVMVVLLFLTGPLQYLPICVLGAIVFTIAIRLVDIRGLRDVHRKSVHEWSLALTTAAAVVVLGVERGILLALVLSLLLHVRHSYLPVTAIETEAPDGRWQRGPVEPVVMVLPGVVVYWFGSDLFYANIDRFASEVRGLVAGAAGPVRWLVIDAGAITDLDYSAGGTLRHLLEELAAGGTQVAFAHINPVLKRKLEKHGIDALIGPGRQFDTLRECLAALPKSSPGQSAGG